MFSSPEPKAPRDRLRRPPVVCPSIFTNDFYSETTGPIVTKFHLQSSGTLGMKSCSNRQGHMAKMAAMSIYGKTLTLTLLRQVQI